MLSCQHVNTSALQVNQHWKSGPSISHQGFQQQHQQPTSYMTNDSGSSASCHLAPATWSASLNRGTWMPACINIYFHQPQQPTLVQSGTLYQILDLLGVVIFGSVALFWNAPAHGSPRSYVKSHRTRRAHLSALPGANEESPGQR